MKLMVEIKCNFVLKSKAQKSDGQPNIDEKSVTAHEILKDQNIISDSEQNFSENMLNSRISS